MPEPSVNRRFVSALEFAALPGAVPCARLHARAVMQGWGLAAIAETVELVVSELTTNAVMASGGAGGQLTYQRRAGLPAIALRLSASRERVLIEVWDDVPAPPIRKEPTPDDAHGRGLMLVEALSARWGWYEPTSKRGKVVWVEVALMQAYDAPRGRGHGYLA